MEHKYEFLVKSTAKNLAKAVLEQFPMRPFAMVLLNVYEDYKDNEKQEESRVKMKWIP